MEQKIIPNLWFDTEAEEAAEFYMSVFKDSRIVSRLHYPEGGPRDAGTVMTVELELNGQRFTGINGGPEFKFDEAVSFLIKCEDQDEIDYYWEQLAEGGSERAVRLGQGPLRPVLAGRARPAWTSCSPTPTRGRLSARCRRCFRWASWTSRSCAGRPTARPSEAQSPPAGVTVMDPALKKPRD